MKKSNWIIAAVLVVVSAFLLWLWFYLGLYRIDEPLDLVLSIVWWVVVIAALLLIIRVERTRKERIRTIYVTDRSVFNSEAGLIAYAGEDQLVSIMSRVLRDLDYGFSKEDAPERETFKPLFMVKTAKYDDDTWEGKVVEADSREEKTFSDRKELLDILRGNQMSAGAAVGM